MAAEDIPFILSRIRANAEWRWKGGGADDLTQLVWDDGVQVEPTQAELDAEQLIIDSENSNRDSTDSATKTRLSSTVGRLFTALTDAEIDAVVERLLQIAGGVNADGTIRDTDEWTPEGA